MEEKQKETDKEQELRPEDKIIYCDCEGANRCGFEPGPNGRLICTACGGYVI